MKKSLLLPVALLLLGALIVDAQNQKQKVGSDPQHLLPLPLPPGPPPLPPAPPARPRLLKNDPPATPLPPKPPAPPAPPANQI